MNNFYLHYEYLDTAEQFDDRDETGLRTERECQTWIDAFTLDGIVKEGGRSCLITVRQDA